MDILSIIGVVLAFGAIIGVQLARGGHLGSLVNGPAMIIVVGGSLGAILLQTPLTVFMRALRMTGSVFLPGLKPLEPMIQNMVEWSQRARKEGLLGLEDVYEKEQDSFVRKGLQLLVDRQRARDDTATCSRSSWRIASTSTCRRRRCSRAWAATRLPSGIIGRGDGAHPRHAEPGRPREARQRHRDRVRRHHLRRRSRQPVPAAVREQAEEPGAPRGAVPRARDRRHRRDRRGENPRNIEAKLQGFLH